jgi:hypothetical protein
LVIIGGLLAAGLVGAVVSMNGNSNTGVANFSASSPSSTS